jgi:acid phosphatase type 7
VTDTEMSRRELLHAAGGFTFLALLPVGTGGFLAATDAAAQPAAAPAPGPGPGPGNELPPPPLLYTALPYIQPGPDGLMTNGGESMLLAWQTEDRDAEFTVDYGPTMTHTRRAPVTTSTRPSGADGHRRRNYTAQLRGLGLGTRYQYRLRQGTAVIAEGVFSTRKPRGAPVRMVAFGDNAFGDVAQRAIAYQVYKAKPDLVLNTGDNVYDAGLDNEYERYFFPVYNADPAGPRTGAPLISTVPFYTVIANHDVNGKTPDGKPTVDFTKDPDSLAFFTAMHLPLSGLDTPPQTPPITGSPDAFRQFRDCAGQRYPTQANYWFDVGDARILCLDSNTYVDPTHPAWTDFIHSAFAKTDARWRLVAFHHGPFNVGNEHYQEQHMRVHAPLFEALGVDMVLSGHEHSYQRSRPLRFRPDGPGRAANTDDDTDRRVPGLFIVDRRFDGRTVTVPLGVIYVITGAGGADLYDPGFTDTPHLWLHDDDKRIPYVDRVVTDRHSFTILDIHKDALTLTQVDQWGHEIDTAKITKPA